MSLSGLHQYLSANCRRYTGTVNSRQTLRNALRGDDVYAKASAYLAACFQGRNINIAQLAEAACQDLVSQRVLSLHDSVTYRRFSKSRNCYLFLTGRRPNATGRRSQLPAWEWITFFLKKYYRSIIGSSPFALGSILLFATFRQRTFVLLTDRSRNWSGIKRTKLFPLSLEYWVHYILSIVQLRFKVRS